MIKKMLLALGTIFLGLAFPIAAQGQTEAVTVNFKTALGGNLGSNSFLRVKLRNFRPFTPTVTGVGVIAQTEFDVDPDSNGLITTSVFRNNAIDPSGTYWTFEFHFRGRRKFSKSYIVTGPIDLNSDTPLLSTSVIVGPNTIAPQKHVHQQGSSSATWTINHDFNSSDVVCTPFDSSGVQILESNWTSATQTDADTFTFVFSGAQTGSANCFAMENFVLASGTDQFLDLTPTGNQSGGSSFDFSWTGNTIVSGTVTGAILKATDLATTGGVIFSNASDELVQDPLICVDDVNVRLGIGICAPTSALHVFGGNVLFDNDADSAGTTTLNCGKTGPQNCSLVFKANDVTLYTFTITAAGNLQVLDQNSAARLFFVDATGQNQYRGTDHLFQTLAGTTAVTVDVSADGLTFGSAGDTNIRRSAPNVLETDDSFVIGGAAFDVDFTADDEVLVSDGATMKGEPLCDSNTNTLDALQYDTAANVFSCVTHTLIYTLQASVDQYNPVDASTVFFGPAGLPTGTTDVRKIVFPRAGTVTRLDLWIGVAGALGSSSIDSTYSIRINGTTDVCSITTEHSAADFILSATCSQAVSAGDHFEIKIVHGTWGTNPTSVLSSAVVTIE